MTRAEYLSELRAEPWALAMVALLLWAVMGVNGSEWLLDCIEGADAAVRRWTGLEG